MEKFGSRAAKKGARLNIAYEAAYIFVELKGLITFNTETRRIRKHILNFYGTVKYNATKLHTVLYTVLTYKNIIFRLIGKSGV